MIKINFYVRYSTVYGQSLAVLIHREGHESQTLKMEYVNHEFWHAAFEISDKKPGDTLQYVYQLLDRDGQIKQEWGADRMLQIGKGDTLTVDTWNDPALLENTYLSQPFQEVFLKKSTTKVPKAEKTAHATHEFRIKAPLLGPDEALCLLGAGNGLHDWSRTQPLFMSRSGQWWTVQADLSTDLTPLAYKYGVWNTRDNKFSRFEDGDNRSLYFSATPGGRVVVHDGFARLPYEAFRGAGVAIPVFSLRSEQSGGVGEFADLPALADWAQSVGLKLIQLLPINDTSATDTWTDSYPYAAISAFALHPLYLHLPAVAGKKHAATLKAYTKSVKALNALEAVDYEAVMKEKWAAIEALYPLMRDEFLTDKSWADYFEANRHWLAPYAVFCALKKQYGTTDFNQWPQNGRYSPEVLAKYSDAKGKDFDRVAIHYFVQWHLHLQLRAAVEYAHGKGLALKGDIPIGIYRHSCDAWIAPELYNMNMQAGAPPDDFAENGQNWGFPTYNWERMKSDDFAWWRRRFDQMSLYFDAFRIDHILGFFRIWSIPLDAVDGILGRFVPAIPVREEELWQAGIGFNYERLCKPYITDRVLWDVLGDDAGDAQPFFQRNEQTKRYEFKPEYDTQRKLETWFETQAGTEENIRLRKGLMTLAANVIFLTDEENRLHFRYGIEKTTSFQHLDADIRGRLQTLYVNYFFRRQDDFWKREALEKLPALKRSTNMLICGEDLGMVPDCVPDVMRDLAILSLEIQRMPKATGVTFFRPNEAPYLSVVTPSTHDMSTIRGWWEENRALTQRFFNEEMGQPGEAPWYCEPGVNRYIVAQHLDSPAMWSIFQLQDLMGFDGALRRENPNDERINVPANPKHYWRYRMHLTLEALSRHAEFNGQLHEMIVRSGR